MTEPRDFIGLYPINYRDLPWEEPFKKYQWTRFLPRSTDSTSVRVLGEPIPARRGDWAERGKYVLE